MLYSFWSLVDIASVYIFNHKAQFYSQYVQIRYSYCPM